MRIRATIQLAIEGQDPVTAYFSTFHDAVVWVHGWTSIQEARIERVEPPPPACPDAPNFDGELRENMPGPVEEMTTYVLDALKQLQREVCQLQHEVRPLQSANVAPRGCICPAGAEASCAGITCPRRSVWRPV